MSIDYFSLPGEEKVDKNEWFASVTCVSGCLNGTVGVYRSIDEKTGLLHGDKDRWLETWHREVFRHGFKVVAAIQNCFAFEGT